MEESLFRPLPLSMVADADDGRCGGCLSATSMSSSAAEDVWTGGTARDPHELTYEEQSSSLDVEEDMCWW